MPEYSRNDPAKGTLPEVLEHHHIEVRGDQLRITRACQNRLLNVVNQSHIVMKSLRVLVKSTRREDTMYFCVFCISFELKHVNSMLYPAEKPVSLSIALSHLLAVEVDIPSERSMGTRKRKERQRHWYRDIDPHLSTQTGV